MKIVIGTALFPPDVGPVASYVKELARRLAQNHEVTVVAYGHLPERVTGSRIVPVLKRRPLPWRLMHFAFTSLKELRGADACIIENGPSVELPGTIAARLRGVPRIVHRGDAPAHRRAASHFFLRSIEHFSLSRAKAVITDMPAPRPEILPFSPHPKKALDAYERSWDRHLVTLLEQLTKRTDKPF